MVRGEIDHSGFPKQRLFFDLTSFQDKMPPDQCQDWTCNIQSTHGICNMQSRTLNNLPGINICLKILIFEVVLLRPPVQV